MQISPTLRPWLCNLCFDKDRPLGFHENKIRKDLFRYQVVVDAQGRSASPSYVRIKPPPPETLRVVFRKVEGTALEMSKLDWGCREYEFAGAASLLLRHPVSVAGATAHAYKVSDGRVRLVFSANDDIVLPRRVTLWREQSDCTAQGISSALTTHGFQQSSNGQDSLPTAHFSVIFS